MTNSPNGNGAWVIDCDISKTEEKEFLAVCRECGNTGDDWPLFPYFAQYIKAWPYESDPTKPESYQKLKRSQYKEAVKRVMAEFQKTSVGVE